MGRLYGKTAIITGYSKGIGFAVPKCMQKRALMS